MTAITTSADGGRSRFERSSSSRVPDQVLKGALIGVGVLVLAVILGFFVVLIAQSGSAFSHFGGSFVFGARWDYVKNVFHSGSMLVGTLITAGIALIIGVPVAVATAIYLTELCPRRLRGGLSMLVDLLAAVPSVVYGLWAVAFLGPKLFPAEKWFAGTFSFIPWIGGGVNVATYTNYFLAGLILAIMILPIVSAISREVLATVPAQDKEAALALGATRWEMIRMAVIPYSRPGITGGAMLGLGRALGETIAVVLVIGDAPVIGQHLFSQGYTLASVIANEFGEATGLHRSALFACGLVLFVLTLLVNMLARAYVSRSSRIGGPSRRVRPVAGGEGLGESVAEAALQGGIA